MMMVRMHLQISLTNSASCAAMKQVVGLSADWTDSSERSVEETQATE